jgi:hypothetical protein
MPRLPQLTTRELIVLLNLLRDRTDPEYRDMLAWAGRGFDPERFDLAVVNREVGLLK